MKGSSPVITKVLIVEVLTKLRPPRSISAQWTVPVSFLRSNGTCPHRRVIAKDTGAALRLAMPMVLFSVRTLLDWKPASNPRRDDGTLRFNISTCTLLRNGLGLTFMILSDRALHFCLQCSSRHESRKEH